MHYFINIVKNKVNKLMPFNLKQQQLLLTFTLFLAALQGSFAQQPTVSLKDSIRFQEFTTKYNNIVNTDVKQADSLARVYFAEAKKIKNDDYCGRGASLINGCYLASGNMKMANEWFKTARQYFRRSKNNLWIGYMNLNMGLSLNLKYNFEKGMPYLLQSVKDFERAKDNNMIVSAYSNIAIAFHDFGNYKKGKEYGLMATAIIDKEKNIKESYQYRAYTALAINYDDDKEWDKAIDIHLQALKHAGEIYPAYTYNDLGNTYRKKGQLTKAIYYLNRALSKSKAFQNDYHLATVYGNMADVYRLQHNYTMANQYIDSTLRHSQKSKSPEKLIDAYDFAYLLKNETRDYKAAAQYLKKYITLKDSLLNADKAKIIYNYQEKYETEKKQELIEKQEFEIAKRNYWLIIALAVFALICIATWFAYRTYKHKQDKKLQNEIYRQQEIESKALFDGEQKERIRIARDLHDGVGQMLSLVKMKLSMADTADASIKKTGELLDKAIEEVRNVSHNLIPEELNFGIFRALEDIAEKVNSSGTTKMEINIPEKIKQLTFERQNELSIYRIVQEVVNNMIKHAGADRIDLTISKVSQSIIISIKDNGRGMDENSIGQSKGLGWKNINARVHLLDGKINITSEKLSGTQIEITLPGHGE